MLYMRGAFLVFLAVVLGSCASPYQVVQLPERDADLYPLAQMEGGITIAIDEIKRAERAARYFGADLVKSGIVPVAVVISNHGAHRVNVKPSDVLLYKTSEIVDPLPIELVIGAVKRERGFLHSEAERQIDAFFNRVAFSETVVLPNETYQGVLFYPAPKPERGSDRFFTELSLFRERGYKVRVGVTDLDTQDRLHFGPFSVSLGESAGLLRDNISY